MKQKNMMRLVTVLLVVVPFINASAVIKSKCPITTTYEWADKSFSYMGVLFPTIS